VRRGIAKHKALPTGPPVSGAPRRSLGNLVTGIPTHPGAWSLVLPEPTDATRRWVDACRAGHVHPTLGRWPPIEMWRDEPRPVTKLGALVAGLVAGQGVWVLGVAMAAWTIFWRWFFVWFGCRYSSHGCSVVA
jgi:hypothetical protein